MLKKMDFLLNVIIVSVIVLFAAWAAYSEPTNKNMVYVEGGTFQMGSGDDDNDASDNEKPMHQATVSSFYMGKYEVTQAEYKAIMGENPSNFTGDTLPVERVTWYDAVEYCNKRSEAEGLTPCYTIDGTDVTCNWNANGYRLPTETEWEYAARGGKNNSPYKRSGSDNADEVAWYYENSGSTTHEAGTKKANALGIYDMNGNVHEWCWDWYDYYSGSSTERNPFDPAPDSCRVIRGGCWSYYAKYCRCAYRIGGPPDFRFMDLGFRITRSAK